MQILLSKDEVLYLRQHVITEITNNQIELKFNCFNIMDFIKKCYKYVLDEIITSEGLVIKNKILRNELENNYTGYEFLINTISLLRIYPAIVTLDLDKHYTTDVVIDQNYNITLRIEE